MRRKHFTLRVAAPSPTWDSRQQLIVNLSKFKTNIDMIRTYTVFSILRHVINSPVGNIFGRTVCGRSYNPTFGYLLWWYCTISRSTRNGVLTDPSLRCSVFISAALYDLGEDSVPLTAGPKPTMLVSIRAEMGE